MILATCQHEKAHKHGKDRQGNQRYKCALCGQTFVKESAQPIGAMRIDLDKAALALSMILEGLSIRSAQRLCAAGKTLPSHGQSVPINNRWLAGLHAERAVCSRQPG
jgi:hypothetical protein